QPRQDAPAHRRGRPPGPRLGRGHGKRAPVVCPRRLGPGGALSQRPQPGPFGGRGQGDGDQQNRRDPADRGFRRPGPRPDPDAVRGLAFSPNNQALVAACEDKSLVVYNVTYTAGQAVPADFGKPLQTFAHAAGATGVLFASDTTLYSSGQDKAVKSWKLAGDA